MDGQCGIRDAKNWVQGRKGGSIGQIPKDWVQRTTLIESSIRKKISSGDGYVGKGGSIPKTQATEEGSIPTEGGSIGEIPKDWVQRTTKKISSGDGGGFDSDGRGFDWTNSQRQGSANDVN